MVNNITGDTMKKNILLVVLSIAIISLLIGCSMANTPTSKVEALFNKYQTIDEDIDSGIDTVLLEQNLTEEHKNRYRKLLENQYKNLSYQIKDELIDGDTATVLVEIEVIDYKKATNDLIFDSTIYTKESYDEEKITRLEKTKDKVKYTLELDLNKDKDGNWNINALTNEEIKKIQGMY